VGGRRGAVLVGLGLVLLVGSACSNETTMKAGVNPLEDNTAPLPVQAGDGHPETLSVATGSNDSYIWAHGRGYVKAAPAAVWKILQDPEVVADRHAPDSHSYAIHSEPKYAFSFRMHYVAGGGFAEWWENWRYAAMQGTFEAPELGIIRYQKTDGTSWIKVLEGSITVRAISGEANACIFENIHHIKDPQSDAASAKKTLDAEFGSVLARLRGKPLP